MLEETPTARLLRLHQSLWMTVSCFIMIEAPMTVLCLTIFGALSLSHVTVISLRTQTETQLCFCYAPA
eukprot:1139420-Pelagomonas_calceolata.AAC.5